MKEKILFILLSFLPLVVSAQSSQSFGNKITFTRDDKITGDTVLKWTRLNSIGVEGHTGTKWTTISIDTTPPNSTEYATGITTSPEGVVTFEYTLPFDTVVIPKEESLFTIGTEGLIIYYTGLNKKIEAEKGTMYVEVYPSSTKVFGIIWRKEGNYIQMIEVTKEQIIKFIPND